MNIFSWFSPYFPPLTSLFFVLTLILNMLSQYFPLICVEKIEVVLSSLTDRRKTSQTQEAKTSNRAQCKPLHLKVPKVVSLF